MDKEFDTINQMYLSQQFVDDSEEKHQVEECRSMIRAYAFTENAIVSMGDNKLNCSYCYFGGLADVLGIAAGPLRRHRPATRRHRRRPQIHEGVPPDENVQRPQHQPRAV